MAQVNPNKLTQSVEELQQFGISWLRSSKLLHAIGYGLLILSIFDVIESLIQPNPRNPVWVFQTIGILVERVPVPLLGLGLIFLGGRNFRPRWEIPLLKILSWLSLLAGILFFLLIPLSIVNTVRIDNQATAQFEQQVQQGQEQVQQVRGRLETANSPEEIQLLLSQLDAQGRAPNIENPQQAQEIRQELTTFIAGAEERLEQEASTARANQRIQLLRNSVKWNLGALVSGVLFIMVWQGTGWIRKS